MVSNIGAHGAGLLQQQPRNISHLNPHFGDVSFFPGGITSNYQSLQSKFQRSISHGVQALASYTHCDATQISAAAAMGKPATCRRPRLCGAGARGALY